LSDDYKVGSCVCSTTNLTGCGIVIAIKENSEDKKNILGEYQYQILTDFGNIIKLTYEEINNNYEVVREDNIRERFIRQKELLLEAENYLHKLDLI
tara:strand:- start:65020 stop:65307 length:288 start_codon:yes stop_codon:yes gene_type:complete